MIDLFEKYSGKALTTDEAAIAHTEINKAIKELEGIKYETGPDYLLLKWGTLKGWELGENPQAVKLMDEYNSIGSNMSAMAQNDTERQKEILCEIIDCLNGTIQNDWDGNYYTKKQAKEYIREYNSK